MVSWILTTMLVCVLAETASSSGAFKISVNKASARRCPGVRTNDKVIMARNGFSYRETAKSRTPYVEVEQKVDKTVKSTLMEFPSCYDFQFYTYIRQKLTDPEAMISIWLLNSLQNVNCSATDINALSDRCSSKAPDTTSCRLCDVCHRLDDLDENVLSKSQTKLTTDCKNGQCCGQPRVRPYRFRVDKLCLKQRDIENIFKDLDMQKYLRDQERLFGKQGQDSIRIRIAFTDAGQSIGCYEVTMDYQLKSA